MKTVSINGMEIFTPGTHNGLEFSAADLQKVVDNFQKLQNKIRPKLKITHREDQEALAGLASYGEVVNVYVQTVDGQPRLYANLEKVPEVVAQWIRDGLFSERSIELFLRHQVDGEVYENVLTAIALLGNEIPAVPGLSKVNASHKGQTVNISDAGKTSEGVLALAFKFDRVSELKFQNKQQDEGGEENTMPWEKILAEKEAQIAKLTSELNDLKAKLSDEKYASEKEAFKTKVASLETQLTELKAFRDEATKMKSENDKLKNDLKAAADREAKFAEQAKTAKIKANFESLKQAGKVVPAVEEKFMQFCMGLEDTVKVAKFSEEREGKEVQVEFTQLELAQAIFQSLPKVVEFSELGDEGEEGDAEEGQGEEGKFKGKGKVTIENSELAKLAQKISKDEKISLSAATIKADKQLRQKA